jgi:hypothetical protein
VGRGVSRHREDVARALRALAVAPPASYRWFGRRARPLPRAVQAAIGPPAARAHLVASIEQELYRSFYCTGGPVPHGGDDGGAPSADAALVEALSAANAGRGGWDGGWRVTALQDDALLVQRDGLQVRARRVDCRPPAPQVGDAVRVRRPKEQRWAAPGFYSATGDAQRPGVASELELRVYFNVSAAGAAELVGLVSRRLNEAAIPFGLKVVDHPARFSRRDAAVLYLRDGDFDRARDALRAVVAGCAPHLHPGVPAFTKALAPGIAVGEHRPTRGASFGSARCRLLAEAAVDAGEHGLTGAGDRLAAVERAFAGAGLRLDVPYLAGGTVDRYAL